MKGIQICSNQGPHFSPNGLKYIDHCETPISLLINLTNFSKIILLVRLEDEIYEPRKTVAVLNLRHLKFFTDFVLADQCPNRI